MEDLNLITTISLSQSVFPNKLDLGYGFRNEQVISYWSFALDTNKYGFLSIIGRQILNRVIFNIKDEFTFEWTAAKWFRNLPRLEKICIWVQTKEPYNEDLCRPILVGCPRVFEFVVNNINKRDWPDTCITTFHRRPIAFNHITTRTYYKILRWYQRSLKSTIDAKVKALITVCRLNKDLLLHIVSFVVAKF